LGKGGKKQEHGKAIIKMPAPQSDLEIVQARLKAAGIPPELFAVVGVGPDEHGRTRLDVSMTPEVYDALAALLRVRLYSPDQTPYLQMTAVEEPATAKERWTTTERRKREKPKKGSVPDHS
jgi:hypothetical protein